MNIVIAGGTGFVGQTLSNALKAKGHHVFIVTRSAHAHKNTDHKTYIDYSYDVNKLPDIYAVINLAGDSLFGYWTKSKKATILTSRIETTDKLIQMMKNMPSKPAVFINGSAVGYYGTSNDITFTEKTTEPGDDFLADVVVQWESCAKQAENLGIRTVLSRFGVILGKDNGALPLMALPVKLFAGGRIGNGEQWIPWVHIEDVVRLIIFSLENIQIEGPINVTAPHPARNKDFIKVLARILKRPYWFPTPAPLLKVALGDMSDLITKGQYVLPKKAETHHFEFTYPQLDDALKNIYT